MSDEQARTLRDRGIQAAQAGQKDQARKLLIQSVRLNQYDDTAWAYLGLVGRDRRESLQSLKKALEINFDNDLAQQAVRRLGIDPQQLVPQAPALAESLAGEDAIAGRGDVPLPNPESTEEMRDLAGLLVQEYLSTNRPTENTTYVKKDKRRAGEREITVLRLQIGAVITILLLGIVGVLLTAFFDELEELVIGPSSTPRPPTSTPTATFTPIFNLTPSATPTRDFSDGVTPTPSPTVDPLISRGRLEIVPPATALNLPAPPDNAIATVVPLLVSGENLESGLIVLEQSRTRQGNNFNPNPYYYEALVQLELGNPDEALIILNEAETIINAGISGPAEVYQSLIDLGVAQVRLQQGLEAFNSDDTILIPAYVAEARNRVESAKVFNNDLATPYLVEAETYLLENNTDEAIRILQAALQTDALESDLNIIIRLGEIYLQRGFEAQANNNPQVANENFAEADYYGFLAHYINPHLEASHELRVRSALALEDTALAVIYSSDYLLFFPDSTQAWRYLGNARAIENNTNLALDAYTTGIQRDSDTEQVALAYAARADLYANENRLMRAADDLDNALERRDDPTFRATQMRIAFATGDYETALANANALVGSNVVPAEEIVLMQARIQIETATSDADYTEALNLLATLGDGLPNDLLPVLNEYRARAQFALGSTEAALDAIQTAITFSDSGSRRYLRAQVYESQGAYAAAIQDYRWILTWSAVYDYPFTEEARAALEDVAATVAELNAQATATATAATAAAVEATATTIFEQTSTAETATAVFFLTRTPTPTQTASPTLTPTATNTLIPSQTPTPTETETPAGTATVTPTP